MWLWIPLVVFALVMTYIIRALMAERKRPVSEAAANESKEKTLIKKMGKKKLEKIERKIAMRKQREWEELQREDAKIREELLQEEKQEKAEKECKEAEKIMERERKIQEQKEKKRLKEYQETVKTFNIEDSGDGALDVKNLIDFLRKRRSVSIQEIADEFDLDFNSTTTQIGFLIDQGLIGGIIDDFGTFVYIDNLDVDNILNQLEKAGSFDKSRIIQIIRKSLENK